MPPPPWLWQPTQFICVYSICPCASALALLAYSASRGSGAGGFDPPGKTVSGLSPAGTVSPSGLPRLCRCSRWQAPSISAAALKRRRLARKREDIEHASGCGFLGQVLHRIGKAEGDRRIARVELAGDDCTGPAADTGDDCDVL